MTSKAAVAEGKVGRPADGTDDDTFAPNADMLLRKLMEPMEQLDDELGDEKEDPEEYEAFAVRACPDCLDPPSIRNPEYFNSYMQLVAILRLRVLLGSMTLPPSDAWHVRRAAPCSVAAAAAARAAADDRCCGIIYGRGHDDSMRLKICDVCLPKTLCTASCPCRR